MPHHLLICTGPSCRQEGAEEMLAALHLFLCDASLQAYTRLTLCCCLGQCGRGPNMVVYPDGTWYGGVDTRAALQIVRGHLLEGKVVTALVQVPE